MHSDLLCLRYFLLALSSIYARWHDFLAHIAKEKFELFGKFFASNSSLDNQRNTLPNILQCASSMLELNFLSYSMRNAIFYLDITDSIPPIVLRVYVPVIYVPVSASLTRLFRLSYSLGTVPHLQRTAPLHPVSKKGNRSISSNYRIVAITSLLSKTMNSLINCQLLK